MGPGVYGAFGWNMLVLRLIPDALRVSEGGEKTGEKILQHYLLTGNVHTKVIYTCIVGACTF